MNKLNFFKILSNILKINYKMSISIPLSRLSEEQREKN